MMSTQCSKRVQAYNKPYYKKRICALSWLITKINKSIFNLDAVIVYISCAFCACKQCTSSIWVEKSYIPRFKNFMIFVVLIPYLDTATRNCNLHVIRMFLCTHSVTNMWLLHPVTIQLKLPLTVTSKAKGVSLCTFEFWTTKYVDRQAHCITVF